jgi:hypothetical protein
LTRFKLCALIKAHSRRVETITKINTMKTIKVKAVKGMLSDSGATYFREKRGMPLLIKQWGGWCICDSSGEPEYAIGKNFKVEVVK